MLQFLPKSLFAMPVAVLPLFLLVQPAAAQKGPHTSMGRPGLTKPSKPEKPAAAPKSTGAPAARPSAPSQQIAKLAGMTADQRQKALAALPPARQQQIETAISSYNRLTPAQRANAAARAEKLESLAPSEKKEVRQSLQDFRALAEDRKKAVRQEVGRLSKLTSAQRDARLTSNEFKGQFSPAEQAMVKNMQLVTPDQF